VRSSIPKEVPFLANTLSFDICDVLLLFSKVENHDLKLLSTIEKEE
jgi:hypothetical protein